MIVGLSDPTKNSFVSSLQEAAIRNTYRQVHKKEPISKEMIIELCNKYEECDNILIVRNRLMILFVFAGFLRFHEISALTFGDVKNFEDYLGLYIRKSKTDQYKQGNEVLIAKGCSVACPVTIYSRYIELVGQEDSIFFYLFRPVFLDQKTHGPHQLIYFLFVGHARSYFNKSAKILLL